MTGKHITPEARRDIEADLITQRRLYKEYLAMQGRHDEEREQLKIERKKYNFVQISKRHSHSENAVRAIDAELRREATSEWQHGG